MQSGAKRQRARAPSPARSCYNKLLRFENDLFALARSFVAFFDRVGFSHVLTLLGPAVKTRTFPVIDVGFSVHPHETMTAARRRWTVRKLATCALRRGACRGTGTSFRRSFRLEQIAEVEFPGCW